MLLAGSLAFLAYWPADATASNATTAEFIRSCDMGAPSNMCLARFQLAVRANRDWGMGTAHNICLPDDRNETAQVFYAHNRAEVRKVLAWLKLHPKFASQSETAGIGAAASALYPCN